ncbi:MAG: hypothetical protein ACOCG5_10560 [Candidatus Alkaliphilus sp. MAG34]
MKNPYTKQALAEDVKREVLAELNQSRFQEQNFIDSIKREVLMELGQSHHSQSAFSNRDLVEAVKKEVLASIQGGRQQSHIYSGSHDFSRGQTGSFEGGTMIQMRDGRGSQEEPHESEQEEMSEQHHGGLDRNLIQAVKNSVMAEMNLHNYR